MVTILCIDEASNAEVATCRISVRIEVGTGKMDRFADARTHHLCRALLR